jgi:hypothetical protein
LRRRIASALRVLRCSRPNFSIEPAAPFASAIRLPPRAPCRPGKKHAVMHEAEDLDHAVRCHSVDDEVHGFADPMLAGHEATR